MALVLSAMANVREPILPINIEETMIAFPAEDKKGVIPVERPTVPNAENSSKSSFKNGVLGSVILRKKADTKITVIEKSAME